MKTETPFTVRIVDGKGSKIASPKGASEHPWNTEPVNDFGTEVLVHAEFVMDFRKQCPPAPTPLRAAKHLLGHRFSARPASWVHRMKVENYLRQRTAKTRRPGVTTKREKREPAPTPEPVIRPVKAQTVRESLGIDDRTAAMIGSTFDQWTHDEMRKVLTEVSDEKFKMIVAVIEPVNIHLDREEAIASLSASKAA